jgi:hypothetical protein
MLVSFSACFSTMKIQATCFSETSVDFQRTGFLKTKTAVKDRPLGLETRSSFLHIHYSRFACLKYVIICSHHRHVSCAFVLFVFAPHIG